MSNDLPSAELLDIENAVDPGPPPDPIDWGPIILAPVKWVAWVISLPISFITWVIVKIKNHDPKIGDHVKCPACGFTGSNGGPSVTLHFTRTIGPEKAAIQA